MSKPILFRVYACTRPDLVGKTVAAISKSHARALLKEKYGKLPPHTGIGA